MKLDWQTLKSKLTRHNIAKVIHVFAFVQIIIVLSGFVPSEYRDSLGIEEEHRRRDNAEMVDDDEQGERREFRERGEFHDAISTSGDATLIFLALSLTMTPLYIIWGYRTGLALRKMTGLYAFLFGVLHTIAYLADHNFALLMLFDEIYIIAGLIAVGIMVPMAITSNRWSIKRLGKNWKRLQRMVYVAAIFTAIHLILIPADVIPALYLMLLLIVRIPRVRQYLVRRRQHSKVRRPSLAPA